MVEVSLINVGLGFSEHRIHREETTICGYFFSGPFLVEEFRCLRDSHLEKLLGASWVSSQTNLFVAANMSQVIA